MYQESRSTMQEDLDKWLNELKKGTTRYSILAILRDGDMYGYELRQEFETRTKGVIVLTEGNAYPALHKMEKRRAGHELLERHRIRAPVPEILPYYREGTDIPERDDTRMEPVCRSHERHMEW